MPFDYSEDSQYAVRVALELAEEAGGELDLVYVVDKDVHPSLYSWGMKTVFEVVPDIIEKAQNKMDEILKTIPNPAGAKVNKVILSGIVHKEIVRHIKENGCDLVVIATHGLVGIDRFLLGSTTERLIRSVNLPILTLKQKTLI